MIRPEKLYEHFQQLGIDFFTGVPDSLFKSFLRYLQDNSPSGNHVITANEGLAVALASGYHISSGKIPLVYLQNSGLGNAINPLTSLADKEMYGIPMVLMIGLRGRPGTHDESQHIKMGRITIPLLETLEIPFEILEDNEESSFTKISAIAKLAVDEQRPVAILVPGDIFAEYEGLHVDDFYSLIREEVIAELIGGLNGTETVVCTTGKIGREFYEQNLSAKNKVRSCLLSVGAMGHANHIAAGIKLNSPDKVVVLDGDGSLLMQMGSLATVPQLVRDNFVHIVINNGSHESVGGQPTGAFGIDLCNLAISCGYQRTFLLTNKEELDTWINHELNSEQTQFVEIRTNRKSRIDLGRPQGTPAEWKENLMDQLNKK